MVIQARIYDGRKSALISVLVSNKQHGNRRRGEATTGDTFIAMDTRRSNFRKEGHAAPNWAELINTDEPVAYICKSERKCFLGSTIL